MINKILEKFKKRNTQEEVEEVEGIEEMETEEMEDEVLEGDVVEGMEEAETEEEIEETGKKKIDKKLIAVGGGVAVVLLVGTLMLIGGSGKQASNTPPQKNLTFSAKPISSKPVAKSGTAKAKRTEKTSKTANSRKTTISKANKMTTMTAPKVNSKPANKTVVTKTISKPFEENKNKLKKPVYVPQNQYAYRQNIYKATTDDNDVVKPANVFKRLFLSELDALVTEKQKELNELSQKLQLVEQAIEEKQKQQLLIQRDKMSNVKAVEVVLPDVTIEGITCYGNKCSAYTNFGVLFVGSKIGNTGEKVVRITPDAIITNKRVIKYY